MPVGLIVLAIPVFFLLIAVELVVVRLAHKDYYRLGDSVNDLSCGVLQQLVEVFLKTALFAGYVVLYERFRAFTVPGHAAWAWAACFLGVDFFYYWFHRTSHEVNAVWATHVVHHQSEEFNLTVALRQGAFQGAFSWVFYLPLALLGFPPLMFLTLSSVNTLYQFWIHTRAIGKLGPLEWVLNTPSNHRVHHGRNPKYIDRNHGGTLIVWDRLFGTYQAEEEEVAYGITTPLRSWNPVWANLHYWVELWGKARRTARPLDKVRMFLKRPGWHPDDLGGFQAAPDVSGQPARQYETPVPRGLGAYILVQFVGVLLASSILLFRQAALSRGALLGGAVLLGISVLAIGGLFERRRWAFVLEGLRLLAMAGWAVYWLYDRAPAAAVTVVATVAAGALLVWLQRYRSFFAVHSHV
ncbi:MAG TPA: sterol desaturase family protein [Vicinamibacteria bacterium]|jgi:sterol desaturase/sphingolipid hydroxylase (fatty acid hydroxylase superfamily)